MGLFGGKNARAVALFPKNLAKEVADDRRRFHALEAEKRARAEARRARQKK